MIQARCSSRLVQDAPSFTMSSGAISLFHFRKQIADVSPTYQAVSNEHLLTHLPRVQYSARDLFFITTTASVEASARCPQIVILSTSIPPERVAALADTMEVGLGSGTSASKSSQARPRAHLHLSAWILEGIDPYSSSHPIPSTRVTYMTALDLGGSVPQRISAMLQTGFPKMITQVESYLQLQAAPPIVRIPEQMVVPGQGLGKNERHCALCRNSSLSLV